jgi:hypothetical protein
VTVMTAEDFREACIALLNQLLTQGFTRPIAFAAIASDGVTTRGSSETVTGTIPPLEKTRAASGPHVLYLLPIHLLLVAPSGQAAHGVIQGPEAVSCRVLP